MINRYRFPKFMLLVVTLLGIYFSFQTRIAEDALDMLPGASLRGELELLQQMGMVNRVYISLEADPAAGDQPDSGINPDLLASTRLLGERLAGSALFSDVFFRLPEGYEFQLAAGLQNRLPGLVDKADLARFAGLISPESLRRRLTENYLRLNTPEGLLLVKQMRRDPLGFTMIFMEKLKSLRGGMNLAVNNGFFVSKDGRHCLLWAESIGPLTSSVVALQVKAEIDRALAETLQPGIKAGIIGPLPHTLANSSTIKRDLGRLLPVAMVVLLFLLLLTLRNWRALLVVSVPFLAVPPALAFLSFFYGSVSAMALGFGIVLLGIGVDFAVHIYLGCQEDGRIAADLQKTLLMAYVTTATVFTVLLFSTVPAHRQMALLAIVGLSWALVLAWQLVPHLAAGKSRGAAKDLTSFSAKIVAYGGKGARMKLVIWLCLVGAGIGVWPFLHYDGDLRSLDVPSVTVRTDEQNFIKTWGQAEQAFVIATADDQSAALDLTDRVYGFLAENELTANVQSLSPVLPGPARQQQNIAAWQRFWVEHLPDLKMDLEKAALETGFTADAFQPFIDWLAAEPESLLPAQLLAGPMRPFITSLFRKVPGGENSAATFLAATMVPDQALTPDVIRNIGAELPGVTVMSNSRWRQQVEEYLKADIVKLSGLAGLLVILICAVFFRRVPAVVAALAPVLSALAAMSLFSFVTGGSLNIMHLLMGIMVIGLSVDYGIFIVRAFDHKMDSRVFGAVSICALSTLTGFGVLAFAEHPALCALGTTVLVGIGAAWPTALFLSPAIMHLTGSGGDSS